jgi:hypothetical protein
MNSQVRKTSGEPTTTRQLDIATAELQKVVDDLARTAVTIPFPDDMTATPPKDRIAKRKRVGKLSKRLRSQVAL